MEAKGKLSGGLCILLSCMLLLLPLQWVLAAVLAALVHEFFHWAAIVLCTQQSAQIRFFSFGARMTLPPMRRHQELLCALAGPLGGLCLLPLARWLPRTAVCAAFQSLYNLLPLYPLDGGRALQSLLAMLLPPPKAKAVGRGLETACLLGLLLLGSYAWLALQLGPLPLLAAVFLWLRVKFANSTCKVPALRVQ